jgi:hypothetical protein
VTPSSRRWALIAVPTLALTVGAASVPMLSPTAARAQAQSDLCARFGDVVETGAIAAAELLEISGLVSSREHGGVLYAHNDAGGGTVVFAMDETGGDLGPYSVAGADPGDWEDIAIGPMPRSGRSAIYIGDIGDNRVQRATVTVLRVVEPDLRPDGGGGELGPVEVLRFAYPDGAVDAEALIVDPRSGDLVIVASPASGAPRIYSATASQLVTGQTVVLTDGGEIEGAGGAAVTAGDISPDGSFLLLRTTDAVLAYERGDEAIVETLTSTPCLAPSPVEPSPQAIAIVGDGSAYITASEVAGAINRGELPPGSASRLYRVSIAQPGEEPPTTSVPEAATTTTVPAATTAPTSTAPSTDTTVSDTTVPVTTGPETTGTETTGPGAGSPDDSPAPVPGDGDDDGGGGLPLWLILVAAALIAAAIVALVVLRRRRNAPLPGSAPLSPAGADPFAVSDTAPTAVPGDDPATTPTEQLPVTPPPMPGALPPPDPDGRFG